MAALLAYPFPGNVRELENAIEHAFVCGKGPRLGREDLPVEIRLGPASAPEPAAGLKVREQVELEAILRALHRAQGDRAAAARALGVARNTLWRKLKKYGIDAKAH